jgi:hypothetical protein
MSTLTEGNNLSDWLREEREDSFSRDQITILAGAGALVTGTVLGKITLSGKYVQLDVDAEDGSQNAAGILVAGVTAESGTDEDAVAIERDAGINSDGLTWPAGASAGNKTNALAALATLGIVAREGY